MSPVRATFPTSWTCPQSSNGDPTLSTYPILSNQRTQMGALPSARPHTRLLAPVDLSTTAGWVQGGEVPKDPWLGTGGYTPSRVPSLLCALLLLIEGVVCRSGVGEGKGQTIVGESRVGFPLLHSAARLQPHGLPGGQVYDHCMAPHNPDIAPPAL